MTLRYSNTAFLTVLDPLPLDGVGWYVRVLSERDYSTQVALLERFTALGFTKDDAGEGGAKVTLDADDAVFTDPLPSGELYPFHEQEALYQIIEDGIVRFEFLGEDLAEDVITDKGLRTSEITGRGTGTVLSWAPVLPTGMPNPTSTERVFTAHPMAVWYTLFLEAQSNGYLPWVTCLFDGTVDTTGGAWGPAQTVKVQAGENLMDLLKRFCEACDLSWSMLPGFRLMVKAKVDRRLESTVLFTAFRDQAQADRKVTRREIANVVYADAGDTGIAVASDGASITRYRKRAVWMNAGGAGDASARSAVANAALSLKRDAQTQRTIKVESNSPGRRVFVDYDVTDWVGVETGENADGSASARRIVAISLDIDDNGGVDCELTLQSAFDARAVKLQKQLDALGGAESSTAGAAPIPISSQAAMVKLTDLQDVDTSGALTGDVLSRDVSGNWVDKTPNLNFLTDVDLTVPPTDGQALKYETASGQWKAGTVSGGGGGGATPAPTVRATNTNYGSSAGPATVTIPATAAVGDLLVVFVGGDWQVSNTSIAGWTFWGASNGSNTNVSVFYKVCVSGDIGATFSATMGGSGGWSIYATAIQNGALVRAGQTQQGTSGTTVTMTNTTAPIDPNDCVLLFAHARIGTKTVTWDAGTAVATRAADATMSSTLWKHSGVNSLKPTVSNTALAGTAGYALASIAIAPATTGLVTSRFESIYPLVTLSTSADTEACKGNRFYAVADATITSASFQMNSVSGKTYKIQCWELNAAGTQIVAQVGSTLNIASPGTVTGQILSTGLVSWPVSAGKWYVVTLTTTDGSAWVSYYAAPGGISPLLISPPGVISYMRVATTAPAAGTTLTAVATFGMQTTISAVSR